MLVTVFSVVSTVVLVSRRYLHVFLRFGNWPRKKEGFDLWFMMDRCQYIICFVNFAYSDVVLYIWYFMDSYLFNLVAIFLPMCQKREFHFQIFKITNSYHYTYIVLTWFFVVFKDFRRSSHLDTKPE